MVSPEKTAAKWRQTALRETIFLQNGELCNVGYRHFPSLSVPLFSRHRGRRVPRGTLSEQHARERHHGVNKARTASRLCHDGNPRFSELIWPQTPSLVPPECSYSGSQLSESACGLDSGAQWKTCISANYWTRFASVVKSAKWGWLCWSVLPSKTLPLELIYCKSGSVDRPPGLGSWRSPCEILPHSTLAFSTDEEGDKILGFCLPMCFWFKEALPLGNRPSFWR